MSPFTDYNGTQNYDLLRQASSFASQGYGKRRLSGNFQNQRFTTAYCPDGFQIHPTLNVAKATENERAKTTSARKIKVVIKDNKATIKKSGKSLFKKPVYGKSSIVKQAIEVVPQLYPNQILIGSIPIKLPSTVSVMATSIKKEENVSMTAPEDKAMQTPKRAKVNTSSTKQAKVESVSTSTGRKSTSTQFASRTVSRSKIKENFENKRGTKKPKVWDTPEAAIYLLSAYYAEKSQNAKSDLEKKKWAFMSGYLLAKEALYGKGAPCKPTNNESPYTSSIAWSETHLMSRPLTKDLTPTNEGSDHSKDSSPSSRNNISQSIPNCSSNQVQFTLTLQVSSTSSSQRKQYEDSHREDMPVLVTNAIGLEEQLHEMQKKLAEKDAEIAALKTQIANHASTSSVPETQVDLRKLIDEGIREFQASLTSPFFGYQKPYPAQYDTVPFPIGYQKPKFEMFDGIHGSPQEHLAHFYSMCGESAQLDSLLLRQFVQSLKGAEFTWYMSLRPGSIQTWDDMQKAFLAQFVSSKKNVSIVDLADTTQKPNESANDFITRWRSLNLQCS